MIKVTAALMARVSKKAKVSPRKRVNYNFHKSCDDPIQRLLNALEPGTYIHPHKHEAPDKREVFVILKGKVLAVEFNNSGKITDHMLMDLKNGAMVVEIPPKKWHSFIALERGSVLYEIKDGPYNVNDDKHFAKWAPPEGSAEAREFNKRILKRLKLEEYLI